MSKKPAVFKEKLKRAEQAVFNNPLFKHMRGIISVSVDGGIVAMKSITAPSSDREAMRSAAAKRLRKQQKHSSGNF